MERELLISRQEINMRVRELAREISADYAGKSPVLVGILNGVIFFFADLVSSLTVPSRLDFIRAKSYGSSQESSGLVKITKDVELPIKDEDLILVEDIVDTGLTLNYIADFLKQRSPRTLKICALIDKPERRGTTVRIDYCGFRVQEGFLVGYGLDFNEDYRFLPDIYKLR